MARVNVEASAFIDPRFARLGRKIGADRHAALGRMTIVWSYMTERFDLQNPSYEISREDVQDLHPDVPGFYDAVIAAELGRPSESDRMYVCGTPRRIEWLAEARVNGKKGAAHGAKGGRPRKTPAGVSAETVGGVTEEPLLAPAPAPAPPPAPAPAPAPPPSSRRRRTPGKATLRPFAEDSPPFRLAALLRDLLAAAGTSIKPPDMQKWAAAMNDVLELDQRDPAEVEEVLRYVTAHPTQRVHLLSPGALRGEWSSDGVSKFDAWLTRMRRDARPLAFASPDGLSLSETPDDLRRAEIQSSIQAARAALQTFSRYGEWPYEDTMPETVKQWLSEIENRRLGGCDDLALLPSLTDWLAERVRGHAS